MHLISHQNSTKLRQGNALLDQQSSYFRFLIRSVIFFKVGQIRKREYDRTVAETRVGESITLKSVWDVKNFYDGYILSGFECELFVFVQH